MKTKRCTGLKIAVTAIAAALLTMLLSACFGTHTVITFQTNGGSPCESITVDGETESITLPTPTRDGYDFDGWYANRALTESVPNVLTGESIPTASVTFYAKWLVKQITITFVAGDDVVEKRVLDYDSYVYAEDFPSLADYPDYRWNNATFRAQYDRTITAVKVTVEDPEYTVSYYVPGEDGFSLYASRKGTEGTAIVSPENPVSPDGDSAKYFAGWYYDENYVNLCRELPSSIGGENLSFYAKFEEAGDDSRYLFYEETADGTGVTIIGFTVVGGYQPTVSIPSEIGGKPVVALGTGGEPAAKGALGSTFLKRVVVPASVREIRDWAFAGCTALEEVIFTGDAVTSIGKGAFAGCVSLAAFNLPDNVTSVGDYAFAGIGTGGTEDVEIDGLTGKWTKTEMKLARFNSGSASKLSALGAYAFYNCPQLVGVKLGAVMREFNYLAFMGSGIAEVEFYEGGNLTGIDGAVYSRSGATLYYYPLNGKVEYTMPQSVTAVAPYAFYANGNIKTVTVSPRLVSIGEKAFAECSALESAYLRDSVLSSVGESAFENCVSLGRIVFPATLVTLSSSAFASCSALESVTFEGSALSAIGDRAFENCVSLGSITVPTDVTSIGNYAFGNCTSLAYLRFGTRSKLTFVGDYAFYECRSIGSVLLPSGITSIGRYAFASESGRMEFEFDGDTDLSNLEYIGDCAFMNTRIASVTISGKIASNDALGKYVFKNCTMLRQAFFSPAAYTAVPEGLFYGCTSLTRIRFSGNIRSVGAYAFYNCAAMEWAEFGSGVTEIYESAFENCVSLTNPGADQRVLPRNLTYLGSRAFYNCSSLETVNIPANLAKIEKETFARCSSLTDINYDDGAVLATIGENAFAYCSSLQRAALPVSLAERNEDNASGFVGNPFYGCANLREYVFAGTPEGTLFAEDGVVYRKLEKASVEGEYAAERAIYAYPTAKSTATFNVSTNVAVIDAYAFYGCVIRGLGFARNTEVGGTESVVLVSIGDYAFADTQITTANISFRVYEIGEGAFRNSQLSSVTVDGTYIYDGISDYSIINTDTDRANNLISIGAYAFAETSIATFTAPSRTALLGEGALSSDYKLSSVTLTGGNLTELTLGARLFEKDNLITEITLPSSVVEVGAYAFYRCSNLGSVRFVSGGSFGLTIGDYAFSEAHYLYEITLPSTVVSLGTGVFDGDTRLKYVYFPETLTVATDLAVPDRAFEGMPALNELEIPEYISKIGEKAFASSALRSITFLGTEDSVGLEIASEAFAKLDGLTEITLPANLTAIGERAFAYSALKEVVYGEGKTFTIGDGAFEGTALTQFTATERVSKIGKRSFANVATLTSFTSADTVTEIPDMAFYGDARLSNLSLGNAVTSLGRECFYGTGITEFLSESVTEIGVSAFGNSAVKKVSFVSSSKITVEERAFENARALAEASFEAAGEIVIGENAFENNAALIALTVKGATAVLADGFASGATSLGEGFSFEETDSAYANYKFDEEEKVLYSADGKKFVYYPAGKTGSVFTLASEVEEIGPYAFYANAGITALIIEGENVVRSDTSFGYTSADLTFYVASDLVEQYINRWQTSAFAARSTVLGGFVLALQSSGDYSVTEYLGADDYVEITGEMTDEEGKTYVVSSVGENAFRNNTVIRTLVIDGGIKTIASGAFRNCYKLASVTIGENVTSVKSYAFYNCAALESVEFAGESSLISIGNYAFARDGELKEFSVPDGVESIGIFAFSGDYSLKEITIGNGLAEIGNNAFENCSSIVSVAMPASLSKMGSYVFSGCDNLVYLDIGNPSVCSIESNTFNGTPESLYFFVPDSAAARLYKADGVWRTHISKILSAEERCAEEGFENYVLRNDGTGYTLIAYLGTETDVEIVSDISDDVKIEEIGEYAIGQFAKNVTVDDGVKVIGERAFYQAKNLATLVLPSSLEEIGSYAFQYLEKLTSVTVNDGSVLASIGPYAFYGCTGLTEIVLPASLRTVGDYAFSCADGESMNLKTALFLHDAVGGTDGTGASVYISIGRKAFANNAELKTLTFNCRVSAIGDGAFDGCESLDSLYLNYNPTRNTSDMVASVSGNGVFGGCEKLSVFLPTTAITGQYRTVWTSDYDKHKLTAVTYRDTLGFVYAVTSTSNRQVTVINYLGDDTEVNFPTETQIGQEVYRVVRIGREKYGTAEEVNGRIIGNNVTKVTIPSTVVTIGEDAFRDSENLKEVTMGTSVNTIEGYAFAGCKKLTDITIPLSVTTIEAYAFYDCDSLNTGLRFAESVAPPATPTLIIGGYAFAECDELASFYVPNHVRTIGGVRTTGSVNVGHTFENCVNLTKITFSSDALITAIEGYNFVNTAIEEIVLPRSLETVADYAFANCSKLLRVVVEREIGAGVSTPTTAGNNVFDGIDNPQLKVYVPSASYDVYAASRGWNVKTVIENNVTPDGLFAYKLDGTGDGAYITLTDYRGTEEICVVPRLVTLQSRDYYVTTIGRYFAASYVKKVEFENVSSVTALAEYAFASCYMLEEIHLPDGITTIGAHAFEGCVKLTDITLSASLSEIKEFTFYNCNSLKEIVLPEEILSIGPSAFYRCSNLSRVVVKFGKNLNESNVGASIGNSAFGDAGTGAGGLAIIVPDDKYAVFRAGWIADRDRIYSASNVVGDYVVRINDMGTALTLVQYVGNAETLDLTEISMMGLYVDTIAENAIASELTTIIVGKNVVFPSDIADRIQIKE